MRRKPNPSAIARADAECAFVVRHVADLYDVTEADVVIGVGERHRAARDVAVYARGQIFGLTAADIARTIRRSVATLRDVDRLMAARAAAETRDGERLRVILGALNNIASWRRST